MTSNYSYKLTKNHYCSFQGINPVLVSWDNTGGPYHGGSKPPESSSTYNDIMLRALANSPLPDDPKISCDAGGDLIEWGLQWLQLREDQVARARLIVKIADKGKK